MAKSYRQRLPGLETLEDAVELIKRSSRIIVLTGAGISTSLGIPDFRSSGDGLYDKVRNDSTYGDYQESPEDIFHVDTFRHDPNTFFACLSKIVPDDSSRYSTAHAFIKLLADKQKLLTNYTQNIDGLEHIADIPAAKVFQCHGSIQRATCQSKTCGKTFTGKDYLPELRKTGEPPRCPKCMRKNRKKRKRNESDDEGDAPDYGILKPHIVLFGESVNTGYESRLQKDLKTGKGPDLLVIIGTSLPTAPIQRMPSDVPPSVPQVWISKQDPPAQCMPDIRLIGEADAICQQLMDKAGWASPASFTNKS